MSAKDHEHRPDFYQRIQEVHGPGSLTFLGAHLALMHDRKGLLRKSWDELVTLHDKLHVTQPEEKTVKIPHDHTQADADLVTLHSERTPQQILRHLENFHGLIAPPPPGHEYRAHAEDHAIALTPEERGRATEADKNRAVGRFLRDLAAKRLGELDHTHLPLPSGEDVSIVATEEVSSWLEGWAIRAENGVTP